MRSRDMTMTQTSALLALYHAPEQQMTLKELESFLHVAQSTAAGITSRLEQKKLVECFGDATDKRIELVRITQSGLEHVQEAEQDIRQAEERLLSGLTETEQSIFYSLLKKVRDTLK